MLSIIFLVVTVLAQKTFANKLVERIVGGTPVVAGEFPWQISLQCDSQHFCGGSIITSTNILTAAHCVYDAESLPCKLKVVTGSNQVTRGQIHNVAKVAVHPGYTDRREDGWKNDVAVITLTAPIQYNRYQRPIALTTSPSFPGQPCTLSGWGQISTDGPLPRNLQKMNQTVVALSECQKTYSDSDILLTNSHLCALNRHGIGACQGDSGGPLISNGVQIGVTSWVAPCAQNAPDVYADVYILHDFIKSQLSKDNM